MGSKKIKKNTQLVEDQQIDYLKPYVESEDFLHETIVPNDIKNGNNVQNQKFTSFLNNILSRKRSNQDDVRFSSRSSQSFSGSSNPNESNIENASQATEIGHKKTTTTTDSALNSKRAQDGNSK